MPDRPITSIAVAPDASELREAVQLAHQLANLVDAERIVRLSVATADVRIEVEAVAAARPAGDNEGPASGKRERERDAAVNCVTAPIAGVFYRRPAPNEPPFVAVGAAVEAGGQVAVVEAMKMMHPVCAEIGGTVRTIDVEDQAVVEFGQQLMTVESR